MLITSMRPFELIFLKFSFGCPSFWFAWHSWLDCFRRSLSIFINTYCEINFRHFFKWLSLNLSIYFGPWSVTFHHFPRNFCKFSGSNRVRFYPFTPWSQYNMLWFFGSFVSIPCAPVAVATSGSHNLKRDMSWRIREEKIMHMNNVSGSVPQVAAVLGVFDKYGSS